MNISDSNSANPYASPGIQYPPIMKLAASEKDAATRNVPVSGGTLHEGQLQTVDSWNPSLQKQVEQIRSDYTKYVNTDSLDGIFEKAFDLYKSIAESADDEETKNWKTAILDDVVKVSVLSSTSKLHNIIGNVGAYSDSSKMKRNEQSVNPETDYAFQELQKGLMQNADQQPLAFLDPAQMQQLIRYAEVANMLSQDAGEGELIDLRSLDSSDINDMIEKMRKDRFEDTGSKIGDQIKELERKDSGKVMDAAAFFKAYLNDPEKDGEPQPQEVGTDVASYAMSLGVSNSIRRLTLDFIDFAKANPNASYGEMTSYLNRNTGSGDLNRMSLSEYARLSEQIGNMPLGSAQQIADIVNGFENTVYSKRDDDELDSQWRQKNVSSGIYDQYGKLRQDNVWSHYI